MLVTGGAGFLGSHLTQEIAKKNPKSLTVIDNLFLGKESNLDETYKIFPQIDLILSPAIGGITVGYEIARQLKTESIFSERVRGKFQLRRGFSIKKNTKVLIIEDVITTGKSSLECAKLVKRARAQLLGFACIIDRSDKKNLLIKKNKIVSQIKISIPAYKQRDLPSFLRQIPVVTPGSRFLK